MAGTDRDRSKPGTAAPRMPAPTSSRPKSPVDQWFEMFVYAPLGFALDVRQLFPRFVDRGRNQVVLARVIGKYAVEHGSNAANEYLGQSQSQLAAVLQSLGLLPEEDEPDDEADVLAFEAGEVHFASDAIDDPVEARHEIPEPPEITAAGPVGPPGPAGPVEALAITDYDNLAASQVVPRLGGLSPDELEAVRLYEAAQRGRKTILNKIAQLQSA
jgi:hypothetical protein